MPNFNSIAAKVMIKEIMKELVNINNFFVVRAKTEDGYRPSGIKWSKRLASVKLNIDFLEEQGYGSSIVDAYYKNIMNKVN
jgi:hypothetical protein